MQTVKNVGATAKAGMDKTKAVVQEKVEKMSASHPAEKEMAEHRKEEKIQEAEIRKQEAKQQNAAAKEQKRSGYTGGGPVDVSTAYNDPTAAVPGTTAGAATDNPITGSTTTTNPGAHGTGGGYNY